jgi:hypothetical protein
MTDHAPPARLTAPGLARWTLTAFVLTFLLSRILVLLIMSRRIPDLYVHAGQTHIHHLNYGIFLLSAIGAWLLFAPPAARVRVIAAVLYGIGLGLTFDEFGLWLHLGGSYWQHASYDAVVALAALLGLLSVAPALRRFRARNWAWTTVIVAAFGVFALLAAERLSQFGPSLERIERQGPQ